MGLVLALLVATPGCPESVHRPNTPTDAVETSPDAVSTEDTVTVPEVGPDATPPDAAPMDTTSTPDATATPDAASPDATVTPDTTVVQDASPDGSTLEDGTATPDVPAPSGDPIAVVVGYGTRRVMSTDGATWTNFVEVNPNGGDDDDLLRGVGYGNGRWVAVGGAGNGLTMTSDDGITWNPASTSQSSFISDAVYLPGIDTWVAAGGNGLRLRSTDGGETWGDAQGYYEGHFRGIAAGNGVAVAVGHGYGSLDGTGLIDVTADGVTWLPAEQMPAHGMGGEDLAFGAGQFIIVQGTELHASSNGTSWSPVHSNAEGYEQVVWAGGEFIARVPGGYYRSSDGASWTLTSVEFPRGIAGHFNGFWFHLGWPATIQRSSDLQSWDTVWSPDGSGMTQMAVGVPAAGL